MICSVALEDKYTLWDKFWNLHLEPYLDILSIAKQKFAGSLPGWKSCIGTHCKKCRQTEFLFPVQEGPQKSNRMHNVPYSKFTILFAKGNFLSLSALRVEPPRYSGTGFFFIIISIMKCFLASRYSIYFFCNSTLERQRLSGTEVCSSYFYSNQK